MTMRFALFASFCKSSWTRLFRQPAKLEFASKSKWQACPRKEIETLESLHCYLVTGERFSHLTIPFPMEIDPQLVKQLREKTSAGFMDCKRALAESSGDMEKAEAILRMKGIASAGKKASRATKEGIVASYIHLQGKVGVLVEVNCETDFVARNENFREFVKDITLHIAAAHPLYVTREQVPSQVIAAERAIYEAQVKDKPETVMNKIVDGKLDKFYSTVCLLEQGFIKNPDQTIKELLSAKISELGEN